MAQLRPALAGDTARLQDIERVAGERFRATRFAAVADHDPFSSAELDAYRAAGRCQVAVRDGRVVGYIVVDDLGGAIHIEQVSVAPDAQGRGIGRQLVAWAGEYARSLGRGSLTLTTFRDVPWNAPLYAHLGFRELVASELTPALREIVAREAGHGLDPVDRVCMRLDLST
jgi:GNAT superfamily N-acetyltransferase